jgi:hypothetical protein
MKQCLIITICALVFTVSISAERASKFYYKGTVQELSF